MKNELQILKHLELYHIKDAALADHKKTFTDGFIQGLSMKMGIKLKNVENYKIQSEKIFNSIHFINRRNLSIK